MSLEEQLAYTLLPKDLLLTIGVFDGVHRGHRRLIQRLKSEASARGLMSGILTFRNHPRLVLRPGFRMGYLVSPQQRLSLLHGLAPDILMMIDFTLDIAGMPAKEFITFLQERLHVRGLVVGPSFALGQGREGSVPTLKMLGAEMKFDVIVQEAETENGDVVSSSVIRDAISHGDVARAGNMMGRPFTLEGEVVRGHRRGTGLGFPTTNLKPEHDRILPGDGIYATWAVADDVRYPSATSIGVRPTFGPGWRTIETHIMDFKGDLYGKEIALEFVERLRDEIRFDSTAALKAQMTRDVEQARQILASRR